MIKKGDKHLIFLLELIALIPIPLEAIWQLLLNNTWMHSNPLHSQAAKEGAQTQREFIFIKQTKNE